MSKNVYIGKGKLAGKGVYAARDFKKGEVVVPYNLKELTQAEFDALPDGEWQWTHSFYGKIYLFPEPERYVNHSDHPSTFPDGEKGDIALRDIKKGEAITINDKLELQRELDTYLEAFIQANNGRSFDALAPFIADDAVFWFNGGIYSGKAEVRSAFEDIWERIQDETYSISDVHWIITKYWEAACSYSFKADGVINGEREVYVGQGTNILKRIDGSWRTVHEHLSPGTKV